ncbi:MULTISPECIES: glycerol-3-phosphate cytidylyltransferase [unclassified Caballeronia]|uniref:glycerol-3-phosphate cytidylyltransferase n=1 Tax=unclassified Caballeronia TaxID=2646786 RepID=UPI00165622E8|nr:glycerol-3-phosphate cytidylyltransferase [Caballeronia sp. GaOx3]MBC8641325.1 glycerol-3-phosphate cytidylyltransferase [Caballeronia sp. EK]
MRTVITYGTFDLLHVGHLNLLRRARALGDRLVVALSTDEFNLNMKNKRTVIPFDDRRHMLEALRCVDLVIPEENWEQKALDVSRYEIDTFVMGDDWVGKFDFLGEYCDVVYLPRTEAISSSELKRHIRDGASGPLAAGSFGMEQAKSGDARWLAA